MNKETNKRKKKLFDSDSEEGEDRYDKISDRSNEEDSVE